MFVLSTLCMSISIIGYAFRLRILYTLIAYKVWSECVAHF